MSPAFNPGIAASRSGSPTHAYVPSLITPLSGPGAFAISPEVIINPLSNGHDDPLASKYPIPFYLGGTSVLIVVVVAMDTVSQVQTRLMSQQYESLIKKTKFGR